MSSVLYARGEDIPKHVALKWT